MAEAVRRSLRPGRDRPAAPLARPRDLRLPPAAGRAQRRGVAGSPRSRHRLPPATPRSPAWSRSS